MLKNRTRYHFIGLKVYPIHICNGYDRAFIKAYYNINIIPRGFHSSSFLLGKDEDRHIIAANDETIHKNEEELRERL
jgi:hypothetical protein